MIHKDEEGSFLYSDPWKTVSTLIVADMQNKRVTIYFGEKTFTYDIIKALDPYKDHDGNLVLKYTCIDDDGKTSGLVFYTLVNLFNGYHNFIKVDYNNYDMVFGYSDEQ